MTELTPASDRRALLDRFVADNLGDKGLKRGVTPQKFLAYAADVAIMSYPKSGKTWISYLATAYIADYLGCPPKTALHIDKRGFLRTISPEAQERFIAEVAKRRTPERWAPLLEFTHLDLIGTPSTVQRNQQGPATERVILLLRDPRDIVVSHYHHLIAKNGGGFLFGKVRGRFPDDYELGEFIRSDFVGIRHVLGYAARWSAWAAERGFPIFYYEDFLGRPNLALAAFLRAAGLKDIDPALVEKALDANSFERLRAAEQKRRSQDSDGALDQGVRRMRKGKAGSYRDELSEADADYLTRIMQRADIPALRRYL